MYPEFLSMRSKANAHDMGEKPGEHRSAQLGPVKDGLSSRQPAGSLGNALGRCPMRAPCRRMMADVLVLGGGLLGVTTAHRLALRDLSVTLLEAREHVGMGANLGNGGLVSPSLAEPWNNPRIPALLARSLVGASSPVRVSLRALPSSLGWGFGFLRHSAPRRHTMSSQRILALARHSMDVFESYMQPDPRSFDAVRCGTVKIFRSRQTLEGHARISSRHGHALRVLDRNGLVELEPQLEPVARELAGGIHFPADIVADSAKFCQVLATALTRMGCRIHCGCRVDGLVLERGAVCGARTTFGEVRARNTVLALGSDPDGVASRAGLRIPVRPVKGYSTTFSTEGLDASPSVPVLDDSLHMGIVPLGKRLRVVGSAEFVGHDGQLSPSRIRCLETFLQRIYPDLARTLIECGGETWAGFRPMSRDGLPFIGRTSLRGLWINSGHGQLGWTLAAGSADLLADLICGTRPQVDAIHYAVDR